MILVRILFPSGVIMFACGCYMWNLLYLHRFIRFSDGFLPHYLYCMWEFMVYDRVFEIGPVAPGNNRDIVGRISRWPDFRPHTPWSGSVLPVLLHSKIDSCFTLLFLLPISSEIHFSESLILHLDSPRLRWMIRNIPDICSRIHVFVWTVRRYAGR